MATTFLGDIPGARFHIAKAVTHASLASNGAGARLGQIGPLAHDVRIQNAWWSPTGADNTVNTASYRRLSIYNGGTAGTVTATASRMASLNLTVSQASLGAQAFTTLSAVTAASGAVLYFSQETVGGDHATGTTMAAGQIALAYEVIG